MLGHRHKVNTELENNRMELCKQIFRRAVDAVRPKNLIRNQVSRIGTKLRISQQNVVDLNSVSGIQIVGFGKAVLPMAEELIQVLNTNQLRGCVLSVPVGTRPPLDPRIEMHCGAKNNIPDGDALAATLRLTEVLSTVLPSDLVIILISGGGSALLPYPKPPLTLQEKSDIVRALSRAGADITELNIVRKKLSLVKGGGLLNFCKSNQVLSLILSDVLGDDLEIIASGPTVALTHEVNSNLTALQVIQKYSLPGSTVSANVSSILNQVGSKDPATEEFNQSRVTNLILGNNKLALEAASVAASESSFLPLILSSKLDGDARVIGSKIAQLCNTVDEILKSDISAASINPTLEALFKELGITNEVRQKLCKGMQVLVENGRQYAGICLLLGGETTVKVTGSGIGGRNQELALAAAMTLQELGTVAPIVICSGGTDGIDGPCDAAGAVITTSTVPLGLERGIDPKGFLENNDSYNYFKVVQNGKFHLVTGHTETNVMDIVICLIPNPKTAHGYNSCL